MDAQQELFIKIKEKIEKLGYDVYDDGLPKNVPYPFIYLGETQSIFDTTKNGWNGTLYITVHVWDNTASKRGDVSNIILNIKSVVVDIKETSNFDWYPREIDQRILTDDTTSKSLLHGIITFGLEFYKNIKIERK